MSTGNLDPNAIPHYDEPAAEEQFGPMDLTTGGDEDIAMTASSVLTGSAPGPGPQDLRQSGPRTGSRQMPIPDTLRATRGRDPTPRDPPRRGEVPPRYPAVRDPRGIYEESSDDEPASGARASNDPPPSAGGRGYRSRTPRSAAVIPCRPYVSAQNPQGPTPRTGPSATRTLPAYPQVPEWADPFETTDAARRATQEAVRRAHQGYPPVTPSTSGPRRTVTLAAAGRRDPIPVPVVAPRATPLPPSRSRSPSFERALGQLDDATRWVLQAIPTSRTHGALRARELWTLAPNRSTVLDGLAALDDSTLGLLRQVHAAFPDFKEFAYVVETYTREHYRTVGSLQTPLVPEAFQDALEFFGLEVFDLF